MKSDQTPPRLRRLLVALGAATLLAGCATTGSVPHPDDPYEGFNRGMFKFNQRVDKYTLRPVARVYDTVAPNVVQKGVTNFFGNIGDIWIGANNILQGKVGDGIQDWMRFLVNSTWGIGGLIDIASDAGLTKHDEDFGQTLAVWGVGEGPYVVLPLFGPRFLRDAVALPVDLIADPVGHVSDVRVRNSATGLRLTQNRATALGLEKTVRQGSLDQYGFVRDFYLQQRRYNVNDGNVTIEYEDFDAPADESADSPSPASSTENPQ